MAGPAHAQLRGRHPDFLARPGGAEIDLEGPPDRQHVEAEKAEHRPGPHHPERDAGDKTHHAEKTHQHHKAGAVQRTVRRQQRREQFRLVVRIKIVACGHDLSVYPHHGQKHPPPRAKTPAVRSISAKPAKKPAKPPARSAAKKPSKPKPWTPAEVREAFSRFQKANPEPKGELEHLNPYTLLVAVVLSAQATDVGVNKATRALFAVADTPQKMLALGEAKAARLHQDHRALPHQGEKRHRAVGNPDRPSIGGEVPRTRDALEALPGVGRKTANVVLNVAFGEPTIAVDTHVFRVANRTGLAPGEDAARGRAWPGARRARRVQARRPSLADPARPLHLPRAQAALRGLPDQRSLPLAGEKTI